jgi:putative colanic acid biosynthesis glycosyltransferase WcaI
MRILVVGINYTPDLIGVAKYNTELCETLISFGHQVRIITAPPYYPDWRVPEQYRRLSYASEEINGASLIRCPIYVPRNPSGVKRLFHHASFALTSLWPVVSSSLHWRPNVVFSVAPSLMSAAFASWIGRQTGALTWLHLQDFEIDAAFDLGLLTSTRLKDSMFAIERKILGSFDYISTISPQMAKRLEAKGVERNKIRELRNWTETKQITPGASASQFRKELGLSDTHFVGGYSGTMSNKQGLELIIDAARSLVLTEPNIRFILCGEGPHKRELQRLASGLTNVIFLGLQPKERFAELLNTIDVHLIPQKAEAADLVLPSKLGGILASGKPVIVMARPDTGLAQEIENAGIVVEPGSSDGLASAVRILAKDPDLCRSFGKAARSVALLKWDRAAVLGEFDKMLSAYTELRKTSLSRNTTAAPKKRWRNS